MTAGNQTLATLPLHPLKTGGRRRLVAPPDRHHSAVVRHECVPLPVCYLNGEYLPLAEARVSPLDRAFLFGDAVYEVVPVYAGRPFRLREHLDRLDRSLAGIRMHAAAVACRLGARLPASSSSRNGGGDQYIYLQVTPRRGVRPQSRLARGAEADAVRLRHRPRARCRRHCSSKGVAAVTAPDTRWARRDIKSTALLANMLLKKLAADAGAFETIMLENGELTEGSSTTVHVVKDGVIHTPPNGQHILPGTTRDVVDGARRRV